MSEPVLLVDREPPVAILTLNRPEQRNALSSELRLAIGAAFRELEADPEIRAVIVTGAGSAFCAGMDLKEMGSGGEDVTGYELSVAGQFEMREGIEEFSGPVIAAVNGAAATAGFELALACDLIFASTTAKFLDTHARVGILPGWGLSVRLPRRIGIARAKEVSLSGNALAAERAYEWGLVNRVCKPDALVDEARALALDICSCVPGVMEGVKKLIDEGQAMPFEEAMEHELRVGTESSKQIDSASIAARRMGVVERGRSQ
ncbi:MAG: enoyl-CoA hydratase [Deltaproteobacteria bacterium]|jgi:enoyl-CoA hydratase|nr:enoyl-CoA hydratase [Deltaproteobacteria bacterium]MBW2495825.1 enoyl-CoA hydratase [Deltaproteobacteria bacterium]